jgi:hypothetical protein
MPSFYVLISQWTAAAEAEAVKAASFQRCPSVAASPATAEYLHDAEEAIP